MRGFVMHRLKLLAMVTLLMVLGMWMFISSVAGAEAQLVHQFDFNGDLTDSAGTGTNLTVHGNTATHGFNDGEWWWTGNQHPGGGLILETAHLTDPTSYSLGFRVRYNEVGPGWRKIISFRGPGSDNGLYFYGSYLQFYPFGSNTAITYAPDTFYDFVFTRGADNTMRVYIVEANGTVTKVYEVADSSNETVPILSDGKYGFMFFLDDSTTSSEWTTGGAVRSIRLWNGVISESDVGNAMSDVSTDAATNVSHNQATLNGQVNPYGVETTITFEYGLTSAYGSEIQATQSPILTSTAVSADVTGLLPATTYHYRVKAVNGVGTFYGADMTFTTSAAPLVPIAVESVTLMPEVMTLTVGGSSKLVAAIFDPANSTDQGLIWHSSNESVAEIVDGNPATVVPVSAGTAVIMVTTVDGGFMAECQVTVLAAADNPDDDDDETIPDTGSATDLTALWLLMGSGLIMKKAKIRRS